MKLMEQSVQSARDELDDVRKRCQEEIDRERRHAERLLEQHAAAEELLQRQVEDAQKRVGIDATGRVSADRVDLPEDARHNLSEILSLLREM